jgi:hypothetical protein
VVYSLFSYHQKNLGGPGSSRGTLEHIRAGLTVIIFNRMHKKKFSLLHNELIGQDSQLCKERGSMLFFELA